LGEGDSCSTEEAEAARFTVELLVKKLLERGAGFVVPIDREPVRGGDQLPICFDWLIWETISKNLALRPSKALSTVAVAVQHHKSESQVPGDKAELWDTFRSSDLVSIENASFWNMNSKRMEAQEKHGDVLITIGGSEGVLYLADLYHQAGKPVIPLNFAVCPEGRGSRKLFLNALDSARSSKFFRVEGDLDSHAWINRINFTARQTTEKRAEEIIRLLESLSLPTVFGVRLLNKKHGDFSEVEDYFSAIVEPVIKDEFGLLYQVVDGSRENEHPTIDSEIFAKLHRASVVVVDLTAARPNCFIELGYALGRGLPLIILAKEGTSIPFDVHSIPGLHWIPTDSVKNKKVALIDYWNANIRRPPLVTNESLAS